MTLTELRNLWYNMGKHGIDITEHQELVKLFREQTPGDRSVLNEAYQKAKTDLDINGVNFKGLQK